MYAQSHGSSPTWVPARVTQTMGPASYKVSMDGGLNWCLRIDQLCRRVLSDVEDSAPNASKLESEPSPPAEQSIPSGP